MILLLRVVGVALWLLVSCAAGLLLSPFRWRDPNLARLFARVYSWGTLRILGIRVRLEGGELLTASQPCVFVANHQSAIDMSTFGSIYPGGTVVIGKKELKWIPLFGLLYVATGNIMIDRQKRVKAIAGLSQAVEEIKRRRISVWIFPEGTRNDGADPLLPFKKGAFHMAAEAGIPVVPVICSRLGPLVSWKERRLIGGEVTIRVLPPMHARGRRSGEIEAFMQDVRGKMLEALRGLATVPTGRAAGAPVGHP